MRERLATAAALFLVLLTAVALRFHGLGWGLRHAPIDDERYFVDNVARMLAERSLDHRFYEYPGLLFYVLLPFQALAGGSGPPATYAGRAVIAAFGVLSVALTFALARRLLGSAPAALTAAALVAVSPLEVVTAHTLRPDVALEAFALLTLLALARLDGSWGADARAGAALALAISTKFTGVLLLPSFLAARACWARLARGLAVAAGVALVLGVLFTPYAWLDPQAFLRGARYQVGFHYVGGVEHGYLDNVGFYLGSLARGLGWPAALLALAGLPLAWRERRTWGPLLLFPAVVVAVMCTADWRYERHVLPALGLSAALAALPVARLHARRGALAALLAGALLCAWPLRTSWNYAANIAGELPRDRVLSWIEAHVPAGSVILDLRPDVGLGLDRRRYEVLEAEERRSPLDPLLAAHVDYVVAGPGLSRRWGPLETLWPAGEREPPFQVKHVAERARPRYRPLAADEVVLSASEGQPLLATLRDGRLDTAWSTAGPQAVGQFLQADFARPVALGQVELWPGHPELGPFDLRLWASEDGRAWRRVPAASGRAALAAQANPRRPASELLLLEPRPVRGLRLAIGLPHERPWQVAEMRLQERVSAP